MKRAKQEMKSTRVYFDQGAQMFCSMAATRLNLCCAWEGKQGSACIYVVLSDMQVKDIQDFCQNVLSKRKQVRGKNITLNDFED